MKKQCPVEGTNLAKLQEAYADSGRGVPVRNAAKGNRMSWGLGTPNACGLNFSKEISEMNPSVKRFSELGL